jgi:FMN phosphatase YigB (HAD superfamily)
MTRPETQRYHLRWLSTILNTPLKRVLNVTPKDFLSDQNDTFNRRDFFAQSGIILNESESHFHFNENIVSEKSLELIKKPLQGVLLIGYELSEETRIVLSKAGIAFIDIWLHPIRFLDDNFFAFRSNIDSINTALEQFHLKDDIYTLYADKLKIQSYMGWDKYKNGLDNALKANSALFVGQTLTDKAICRNGTMLNVLNFKEEFTELTKRFSHVYFSRHPMIKGDDAAQLDFILSHENTSITTEPGYKLLCTESIEHVTGVSSSLMYESKFFGKEYSYLYRPVLEIHDNNTPNGYFSIFSKLHSPSFWQSILQEILPTSKDARGYDFLSATSNYRDMLALYYNTHVFDKNHSLFVDSSKSKANKRQEKTDAKTMKFSSERLQANPPSLKKLERLIDLHETISFDVFDTLLQRKTWVPGDVIALTAYRAQTELGINAEDFTSARREAKKHSTKHEVPLSERYEIIGRILKLDAETAAQLYSFEIEIEKGLLEARTIGKLALEYAQSKGKRVVITSDTYFTEEQIREFLSDAGIYPDEFYASSTYDQTKEAGGLYKVLLEKEKDKLLHVGDNYKADITNANANQINSSWVISNHDQFKNSTPQFLKSKGPFGSLKNGLVQRNIAGYPSITNGAGYTSGKPYNLGYSIVGEMMLAFAAWIIEKAKIDGVTTLFFLARDGEIVKKVADNLLARLPGNTIKTHYLLASRRSTRVAALRNVDDVMNEIEQVTFEYSKNPNKADLNQYLSLRFGLPKESLVKLGIDNLNSLISSSENEAAPNLLRNWLQSEQVVANILDNASEERLLYSEYLDQSEFIQSDSPVGIVDIGHNGSLQASLAKARNLTSTRGYYFCTYDQVDSTLSAAPGDHKGTGFYRDRISTSDRTQKYIRYALIIESLFLNNKGTFLRIHRENNQLVPSFLEGHERARVAFNEAIHQGSLKYTQDLLDTIEKCFESLQISQLWMHDDICARLFSMLESPMFRDAEVFSGITIENYFAGRPLRYFVPPKNRLETTPVLWKEGTQALVNGINAQKEAALEKKTNATLESKKKSRTDIHKQYIDLEKSAQQLYAARNFRDAANEFHNAFNARPAKPNLLRAASEAYLLANDKKSAIEILLKAKDLMPNNRKLKLRLLTIKHPILKLVLGENKYVIPTEL